IKYHMNILLIGKGGREHALSWKISQSAICSNLFIIPGNPGTAQFGTNLNFEVTDFEQISKSCLENNIELVVVGPEDPLVLGITDYFKNNKKLNSIKIIGPSKVGAQLEGSKSLAKEFMLRNNIPTARYKRFTKENYSEGVDYISQHSLPIVIKADGLAAGKGVVICQHHIEALAEFDLMINHYKFGEAGSKVVIEEFLTGIEMSIFALTDGKDFILLPEAKDYKKIGVGETGLNTGGMGAVSPLPFFDEELKNKVINKIIKPTIDAFKSEGLDYTGFVFFGLMINDNKEPFLIEYNCRLGDPETEVVLPRIKNDMVELFLAAANNKLSDIKMDIDPRSAATIVAVSGGYPGIYKTGYKIKGIENEYGNSIVFHAGTTSENDKILTNGGRVFTVTSFGDNIKDAVDKSLETLENIYFEDIYYRDDIGFELIE
ncbi:MAG: phosphoribosylamine--glycine ligase, partial [Ferruginibacter sp.]